MPDWGTQDYKNEVLEQLSKGTGGNEDKDHFEHFENMAGGAPRADVENGVGEAFHPERVSSAEAESQFLRAAQNMKPQERAAIAQDFMQGLQGGQHPSWLQRVLGMGKPSDVSPEDVARVTEYARQNQPDLFKRVVADKPFFVRWMDKPLVAALVGILAGKMLNRGYRS